MVQHQVRYIRYDTVGSAARKPVTMPSARKAVLPKPRKQKRAVVYVDPVAVLGIFVAVLMLITMTAGIVEFAAVRQETICMEEYVDQLSTKNRELRKVYEAGYDLEAVEKTALALGMVPKEQVQTVTIHVEEPVQTQTVTVWERIGTFLTGLFA